MLLVEHMLKIFPFPSLCVCAKLAQLLSLSKKSSHEHAILQPVPHRQRSINSNWTNSLPESGHRSESGCFNAVQYLELTKLGLKGSSLSLTSALNALGMLCRTCKQRNQAVGLAEIGKNIQDQKKKKKKKFDPRGSASPLKSQSLCERNTNLQVKKSSGTSAPQCLLPVQSSDYLLGAHGPMPPALNTYFYSLFWYALSREIFLLRICDTLVCSHCPRANRAKCPLQQWRSL